MTIQTNPSQSQYEAGDVQPLLTQLIAFINHELLVEEESEIIDAETPLLEMGMLDSLAMVSLLAFVERDFGVRIPDDAVIPEHFETLQALAELIADLQLTQPASAAVHEPHSVLADTISLLESSGINRDTIGERASREGWR